MHSTIDKEFITCGRCGLKFERSREFTYCSNCFACTGCEIYYCPECDNEIIVTPIKEIRRNKDIGNK